MESLNLIEDMTNNSHMTESYRAIRTNLLFGAADKKMQTVGFISAMPGEGKSTTCVNMSVTMAQAGKRVLAIDCDLRKPTLHKKINVINQGLTNYISLGEDMDALIHRDVIDNLDVLTSGPIPPNPAELILSERMQSVLQWAREKYDYVFLDFPPVLLVADAFSLVNQVDTFLWVLESGVLTKEELRETQRRLQQHGASVLGVIMNKVPKSNRDYYYGS